MATVVNSVLDADSFTQKDGRTYVRETHTDSIGAIYKFEYLADALMDRNAIMLARAASLIPNVQTQEMLIAIALDLPLASLVYNTASQAAAFVRSHYQQATKDQLALTARWILDRISSGEVTDTQVANAFGLTTTQWTTLKSNMQTLVADYSMVQTAVGQ